MIINFDKLKETVIPNFHGGEKETKVHTYADKQNKIMCGKLESGASIGLHKHETNSEILYITQGTGKVLFDGNYEPISVGLCHYCPKGHEHGLINDGDKDLAFFAVVAEQ